MEGYQSLKLAIQRSNTWIFLRFITKCSSDKDYTWRASESFLVIYAWEFPQHLLITQTINVAAIVSKGE